MFKLRRKLIRSYQNLKNFLKIFYEVVKNGRSVFKHITLKHVIKVSSNILI